MPASVVRLQLLLSAATGLPACQVDVTSLGAMLTNPFVLENMQVIIHHALHTAVKTALNAQPKRRDTCISS